MKTVEIEYEIGEDVYIACVESSGIVTGIYITAIGVQYQVQYMNQGRPETAYLLPRFLDYVPHEGQVRKRKS